MKFLYVGLVVVLLGGIVLIRNASAPALVQKSSPLDTFAECIKDAGAKFYGAYWCPHCKNQKKLFNDSKKLPYVECSTPDGQGQTKVCADAGVSSYPTWILSDGTRLDGEQTLETLAEKTSCALPEVQP